MSDSVQTPPDAGLRPAIERHQNLLAMLGHPPTVEDQLRGKCIEALHWLELNAPSRAHETLREALLLKAS